MTPWWRRFVLATATVAVLGMGTFGWAAAAGAATNPGSTAGTAIPRVGAYARNLPALRSFDRIITHRATYVSAYLNTDGWAAMDNPGSISWYKWEFPGYQLIWNVPMLPMVSYGDTAAVGGANLATEATGAYDGYFVKLARELVAAGQGSAYVRPGWEMNANWYPWGNHRCPGTWHPGELSCYAKAWQHIVTAMRSVSGAHFRFEWVTAAGGVSPAEEWPGRAYVNVVGVDMFDWNEGGPAAWWHHLLTAPAGLDYIMSLARRVRLPEAIGEWGLSKGTVNSNQPAVYFIEHCVDWIFSHNVVDAEYWVSDGVTNKDAAWALWHTLRGR